MEDNTDPEVIRQRMTENRQALTSKLEALEQQVLGVANSVTETVENVKEGVQETVDAVKDTVQDTVGTVKEGVQETVDAVKESFNLRLQFERRPWIMLGGSVGVGLVLGAFLRRRTVATVGRAVERVGRRFRGGHEPAQAYEPVSQPVRTPEPVSGNGSSKAGPGIADSLLEPVKEGLNRVKDLALGTLFGTLQKVLVRELPEAVEGQIKTFIDDTVNRLKGAIKHEQPAEPEQLEQSRRRGGERQGSTNQPETGVPRRPGSW